MIHLPVFLSDILFIHSQKLSKCLLVSVGALVPTVYVIDPEYDSTAFFSRHTLSQDSLTIQA